MADLSNFKRGQIVGVSMVDPNITKIAELFIVGRNTFLKVMTAFE